MKPYEPSMRSNTCFFSDAYPDTIFRGIADVFEASNQEYEISENKWRINYSVVRKMAPRQLEIVDEIDREIQEMEESKAAVSGIEMQEDAEIQIDILDCEKLTSKATDIGWVCIEFTRKSGSSTLFWENW